MNCDTTLPAPARRLLRGAGAAAALIALHPLRVPPVATPGWAELRYRALKLDVEGAALAAWHVPREGSDRGLVLCHGHNNCRNQLLRLLRPLHEAGFHLLLFDMRAHGLSGGLHCTYGRREHLDVLAAVEWMRAELGVSRPGLYGISMGAASALLAAERDPEVGAVVSDCAFARLEEVAARSLVYLPSRARRHVAEGIGDWTQRWCGARPEEVAPEDAVRRWRSRPLLVIHAGRDRLVPVEHAHRLAAAGGPGTELWIVPGARHALCHQRAAGEYEARVAAFFRRHLGSG